MVNLSRALSWYQSNTVPVILPAFPDEQSSYVSTYCAYGGCLLPPAARLEVASYNQVLTFVPMS